jgi:hypothetical protein
MSAMWMRWYRLIPDPVRAFQWLHGHLAWYMPGMVVLGFVPAVAVLVYLSSWLFGKFSWFHVQDYYRFIYGHGWRYAYVALWLVYLLWIPLPWPRIALLLWTLVLMRKIRYVRWRWKTREKRRRAWQAVFDERWEDG